MTAALNLGLLGNNVNSSGQVSLTAGVSGTLPVSKGGTGATTLAANNVLLGNGTSALQAVAPGASGNVLASNGSTWVSSSTGPAPTTTQVLNATAAASVDAVGSYAYLYAVFGSGTKTPGTTVAASSLRYSNAAGQGSVTPSGTWRCMGYSSGDNYSSQANATLWLRIS